MHILYRPVHRRAAFHSPFCPPLPSPSRPYHAQSIPPRCVRPSTATASPSIPQLIHRSLATTALILSLSQSPVLAAAPSSISPSSESPAPIATPTRRELIDTSRRNTRLSGTLAQTFSLARRAASAGDLPAALELYNTLVRDAPSFAPAYSNRANILVTQRRLADADDDYTVALALAPLDADAWLVHVNRSASRLAQGRITEALNDLNDAAETRPDSDVVMANRAAIYEQLGKWDNAIRDYQNALRSNDVKPFWVRYGLVLFQRNKPFEAIAIVKRAAAKFPDAPDVHAALAAIYFDRGDLAAAETEWSLVDRPRVFEKERFLVDERKWPPRAVAALRLFRFGNLKSQ